MNKDSQIYKAIQRSNMMMIVLSVIGIITVVAAVVLSSGAYWMAQLTGPIDISGEEIAALDGSVRLYNQAVSGLDMDDTYYYEETYDEDTGRQVSIDAYFGALEVQDDVWILVRQTDEINRRQDDYVGTLQPVPSGSVTAEVYGLAEDELDIEFLPIMLDTTGDEFGWYIGTGALIIIGLLSLWGVFAFIQRSGDVSKHPILKKLSRFGNVDVIISDIENELGAGKENPVGKLRLTRNYLVHTGTGKFEAMPYNSVAWVYKMVNQGRYGKTFQAHIYDDTGTQLVLTDKEQNVNAMLQAVAARAPWAIAGFSEEIKTAWNKDRQNFLAEVENRRRQTMAQS